MNDEFLETLFLAMSATALGFAIICVLILIILRFWEWYDRRNF